MSGSIASSAPALPDCIAYSDRCHPQSRVHPRTKVPVVSTVLCGVVSAVLATFVPLDTLSHLVSLGTLVAFAMVCLGEWHISGDRHCL